jgi:hypothetical protein
MSIVAIYARDWGVYSEQIDAGHEFGLIYGWVVGRLLREDDEKMVIAHHWFPKEDQVRHTTTVQKSCVIRRVDFRVKA